MVRHKVYVEVTTYSNGERVRTIPMNGGRKKIDEVSIYLNADGKRMNMRCLISFYVTNDGKPVISIMGGSGYIVDLLSFNGEHILVKPADHVKLLSEYIADVLKGNL